jgi:predicted helicase
MCPAEWYNYQHSKEGQAMKINLQHTKAAAFKIHPQHNKAFDEYERHLQELRAQYATNEEALRPAFQNLLTFYGREMGWTLVLERALANGAEPDGTLLDSFHLPRGYWEAKDTRDDLEKEIQKKIARGYPLTNSIFEDTRRAVLYQNGRRVPGDFSLEDRQARADLLIQFFSHTEPDIERFDRAVEEFRERIPDQARGVLELIHKERKEGNREFAAAFEAFHALCKDALNPQISAAAIEEMLVQHLLTERLFRTIFDNPDFIQRNVIAREIERVIQALTRRAFNRTEFLRQFDRFYVAIEQAARSIGDWTQKQAFLNTVYERFFQGFSVKQADTFGVVYTPQAIVDFMVASVEEVLQREFGRSLSSPGVKVLDPCTGTGNFIVNILRRVAPSALRQKYTEDLFANEIMLLPYYIASLNIEHAYYERAGAYLPFEGMCFVDTLDMVLEGRPQNLWLSQENTERIARQNMAEITVVIGNPPYNVGQQNENDNNKNRRYDVIDKRVRDTYAQDSKATNKNALSDMYVKFFRWATDRLGGRDGIVCFVSNNSFVDQIAFDGMRQHLLGDFTQVFHIDLHGNVRKNPKLSGTTHNVFGIQVGVGITIAVRASQSRRRGLYYYRVPENWRKEQKLKFLAEKQNAAGVEWQQLQPDEKGTWLTEGLRSDFDAFVPMGTKEAKAERAAEVQAIFKTYGGGVKTNRDDWAYDYDCNALIAKIKRFIDTYNGEVAKWPIRSDKTVSVDNFVTYDDTKIKWSRDLKLDLQRGHLAEFADGKVRRSLYRPFCKQWLFFDRILNEEVYQFPQFFPTPASEAENEVICLSAIGTNKQFHCLIMDGLADIHLAGDTQCFPFYTYAEDGSSRLENITDWALKMFQSNYGAAVTKWDIFHYVYALLHHPTYRERYAENLKRELPRIPLVEDRETFAALVQTGRRLAELHLHYEQAAPYPLRQIESRAVPFTWRVSKMRLARDKRSLVVNDALTLEDIPAECFAYRLGNRSALEWVIDQYRVSTDARSGLTSDPNRDDDPEYIARLVKQVVTVSLETVKLVAALPEL